MITTAQRLMLSLPLVAFPLVASAFNLGQLNARSRTSEILEATIELYLAPYERAAPMVVTLAPDLFSPQTTSTATLLSAISSTVEHLADGYSVIRLRSATPINVTEFSFRLRAAQGPQTLSRVYTINLRAPPAPSVNRNRVRKSSLPTAVSTSANTTQSASLTGTEYGPVRSGETLWAIAKSVRGSSSLNATLQALHAANLDAFVNGDVNRLKLGVTLRLPTAEKAASTASVSTSGPATEMKHSAETITEAFFASEIEAPPSATVEAPRATVAISQRDPALAKKLADLDAKFAAIRAQYATGSPITAPRGAPAAPNIAASPKQPVVLVAPVAATEPAHAAPPTDAVNDKPASTPPVSRTLDSYSPKPANNGWRPLLIGLLFAPILTVAVITYVRRERQARRNLEAAFVAREAKRKAEVAAKAGHRTQEEPERQTTRRASPHEDLMALDRATALDGLDVARALTALSPPLDDTQNEIDASIANGRYQDAARLLQQVIVAAPRNLAAKLRLAEVFYITERVEEFGALAEDLQRYHRGDLTNEEWRRVMRMGKIIAPDIGPFAGPLAVNSR